MLGWERRYIEELEEGVQRVLRKRNRRQKWIGIRLEGVAGSLRGRSTLIAAASYGGMQGMNIPGLLGRRDLRLAASSEVRCLCSGNLPKLINQVL